jgi:hypothetical protein
MRVAATIIRQDGGCAFDLSQVDDMPAEAGQCTWTLMPTKSPLTVINAKIV